MDISFLTSRQHDLRLPAAVRDRAAASWVSTQANLSNKSIEEAPFRRMYNFWLAGIVWAEYLNLEPDASAKGEKFVSSGPTPNDVHLDTWILEMLLLIAVNRLQPDVDELPDAADVFSLANKLAAAGTARLLADLESRADILEPRLYTATNMFQSAAIASRTEHARHGAL
jgi:hypothetical protein